MALSGRKMRNWGWSEALLAWWLFAEVLFFGLLGVFGLRYDGEDASYRVYRATLAALTFAALMHQSLGGWLQRGKGPFVDRDNVKTYLAVVYATAIAVGVGLLRFDSPAMVRTATLYLSLAVPAMLAPFLVRHVERLVNPLFSLAAAVTVLLTFARLRGTETTVIDGRTEVLFSGVGGATHLTPSSALALCAVIQAAVVLKSRILRLRIVAGCLALVSVGLIVQLGSRGALVSVIVALSAFLLVARGKKIALMLLAVGGGAGIVVYLSSESATRASTKIADLLAEDVLAADGRNRLLGVAMQNFLENPALGSGVGSFSESIGEYGYAHNLLADVANDFGVGGLVIAVLLLGKTLIRALGYMRLSLSATLMGGLAIAVVSQAMFSGSYLASSSLWIILGCLWLLDVESGSGRLRGHVAGGRTRERRAEEAFVARRLGRAMQLPRG